MSIYNADNFNPIKPDPASNSISHLPGFHPRQPGRSWRSAYNDHLSPSIVCDASDSSARQRLPSSRHLHRDLP